MASDGVQWGWKSVNPKGSPAPEPEETPTVRQAGTFIGSGALFEGTLSLKGDFCIDSEFRGELCTEGKIVVGPGGSVVGNIRAREVEVQGAVVGNVCARRLLILHEGSRVHGDLETACLEIERHAFFQGATKMTEPQARRDETAAAARPTPSTAVLPAQPVQPG
jgi:cytoskeletal protein CcmA (bactofilin family)